MPWKIYKSGDGFDVNKENPDGSKGALVAHHKDEAGAKAQLKALYASENKEIEEKDMTILVDGPEDYGPVSFAEMEASQAAEKMAGDVDYLTAQFQRIVGNICDSQAPIDRIPAIAAVVKEYETRLNAIPTEVKEMDKAAKKLPFYPPPKPPKKGESMNSKVANLVTRIVSGSSKNPKVTSAKKKEFEQALHMKEGGKNILFTKEADGRMRFLCDYSNNYRDRDNPPEILSAAAHERFVKEVDDGEWPMPELWWWHLDGSRLGQADWLGYDKETGISLASGFVDKGMEAQAEAIQNYPEPVGVSHGMIVPLLERDSKDKSTITRYVSREISALPARAAANPLTEFTIGKEINMALTPQKRQSLIDLHYSEAQIKEVEERNKAKADKAQATGLESKEAEAPVVEEPKAEPVEEEKEPEAEVKPVEPPITREEVAEAVVKAFTEAIKPVIAEQQKQGKLLSDLQAKALEDAKKELSATPSASLGAMLFKQFSAVGNPETLIDGRSSLKKSGPKENTEDLKGLPEFLQSIVTPQ
jgi:hypothetical protein